MTFSAAAARLPYRRRAPRKRPPSREDADELSAVGGRRLPDSLDARTQAEGIVAQTANGEIQADAAADRMTAESDALTAIVGRIDGLTAPQDQAAQRIQNLYHDAVQHWIAASRLYVRWMKTVWQYYDDQGYTHRRVKASTPPCCRMSTIGPQSQRRIWRPARVLTSPRP